MLHWLFGSRKKGSRNGSFARRRGVAHLHGGDPNHALFFLDGLDRLTADWRTGSETIDRALATIWTTKVETSYPLDASWTPIKPVAMADFGLGSLTGDERSRAALVFGAIRASISQDYPGKGRLPYLFGHTCDRLFRELLQCDGAYLSEQDAAVLFASFGSSIAQIDHLEKVVNTLLVSNPTFASNELAASVTKMIAEEFQVFPCNRDYVVGERQKALSLDRLVRFVQLNPDDIPYLVQYRSLEQEVTRRLATVTDGAAEVFANQLTIELKKPPLYRKTPAVTAARYSPEKRAEVLVSFYRVAKKLIPKQHYLDAFWTDPLVCEFINVEKILEKFGTLIPNLTRRDVALTQPQAEFLLEILLEKNFRLQFRGYLRKHDSFMAVLANTLPVNDVIRQKIEAIGWPEDGKKRAAFIEAYTASPEAPDPAQETEDAALEVVESRKALSDLLFEDPPLVFVVPAPEDTPNVDDTKPPLHGFRGQMGLHYSGFERFLRALLAAAELRIPIDDELKAIDRLIACARRNVECVKAGQFEDWIRRPTREESRTKLDRDLFADYLCAGVVFSRRERSIEEEERECVKLGDVVRSLRSLTSQTDAQWMFDEAILPSATASKPTKAWLKKTAEILTAPLEEYLLNALSTFVPIHATAERLDTISYHEMSSRLTAWESINSRAQRRVIGFAWAASLLPADRAGPILATLAQKCLVSEKGIGIRAEKLGNACLVALELLEYGDGARYLARLISRTRYPSVRKKIDKALNRAAAAAKITRSELEELIAPEYGFDLDGTARQPIGRGAIIYRYEEGKVTATWETEDGSPQKSVPKALKEAEPEAVKEAKAHIKEIEKDIQTQRHRLEGLLLSTHQTSFEDWRTRYLEHDTVRLLATGLLWRLSWEDRTETVLPVGGILQNVSGQSVDGTGSTVTLWHPISATVDEVARWRDRLEALELVQPIKQVWRETYSLTEAERETATYSNRWAGHIIRQHQAMTLAQLNGWKCTHRMLVDAPNDDAWHILLPAFGLQAEFWIDPRSDTDPPELDSQALIYVHTDRLMFHKLDEKRPFGRGEVLPLERVPDAVFSEVMRYCDLMVSVASISTDPTWMDRGADAAHPNSWEQLYANDYWAASHTFNLSGSAQTRREALKRLVPHMKILGPRVSFEKNHLRVRGNLNEYLIHIGSAGVLMQPGNKHLCIVPDSSGGKKDSTPKLPFVGDATLAVILSKATMLAEDDKIADPGIKRQISP